jgi:hypothetical protein
MMLAAENIIGIILSVITDVFSVSVSLVQNAVGWDFILFRRLSKISVVLFGMDK